MKIGLFGFGCVGQGLYYVLNNSTGFKAEIPLVNVKDRDKKRTLSDDKITYNKRDIIHHPDIDVVVELIDDATAAFSIVSEAMQRGKNVVTANKKMLAIHLRELIEIRTACNVSLLYEASTAGSIPLIRTLEEYYDNEEIIKVSGIFNGTTNYILSSIQQKGIHYEQALLEAQEKGFAESDPTNDIEGYDAGYKTIITALHAFGVIIPTQQLLMLGISALVKEDLLFASEKGYKIKLLSVIERLKDDNVAAYVLPAFVNDKNPLYTVDEEFNGILLEGKFSGSQFLKGRGAGSLPTGAAVLSDTSALSYGYAYEYKKFHQQPNQVFSNNRSIKIYLRYHNEEDLNAFCFEKILEKFTTNNFGYIIGNIPLINILQNLDHIKKQKLFVASLEEL